MRILKAKATEGLKNLLHKQIDILIFQKDIIQNSKRITNKRALNLLIQHTRL